MAGSRDSCLRNGRGWIIGSILSYRWSGGLYILAHGHGIRGVKVAQAAVQLRIGVGSYLTSGNRQANGFVDRGGRILGSALDVSKLLQGLFQDLCASMLETSVAL